MQSFQDFLKSRRQKTADTEEHHPLKHSRSTVHTSSHQQGQVNLFQRSLSSRSSPGSIPRSQSPSFTAAADAPAVTASTATTHTTTTVLSGGSPPFSGRYLSRVSTATSSRHKLSDGLATSLQQLVSPQRSLATLQEASTGSIRQRLGSAATTNVSPAAAPYHAASGQPGECSSSKLVGFGSTSQSRLQPLSVQDALTSTPSRSAAATPPGARTPTGGRRYAAAGTGNCAAATCAAAATDGVDGLLGGWPAEGSATAVLREAAARAASLSRSTTMRSQAGRGDLAHTSPVAAAQQPPATACVADPDSQQQPQQQAVQQQPASPGQQQPQQSGGVLPSAHGQMLHQQQEAESAAALLQDLDQRFASLKDSFKGLLSPPQGFKQNGLQACPPSAACSAGQAAAQATTGVANSKLPAGAAGRSSGGRHGVQYVGSELAGRAGSCNGHTSCSSPTASPTSGMHRQHGRPQQQQQQLLLSPTDSSRSVSSSDSRPDHRGLVGSAHWQQHQQGQSSHTLDIGQDVTLCGGVAGVGSTTALQRHHHQQQQRQQHSNRSGAAGQVHGNPAAAAAAVATAATAAAVADVTLPLEVDVNCGDGGELLAATAHFVVSPAAHTSAGQGPAVAAAFVPLSSAEAVVKRTHHLHHHHQHQQQQQQQRQRQGCQHPHSGEWLVPEQSLPSSCDLLSTEPTGTTFPLASPSTAAVSSQLDTQLSNSSRGLGLAGVPQPRTLKPKPSVMQRQQPGLKGSRSGPTMKGSTANRTSDSSSSGGAGGGLKGGPAPAGSAAAAAVAAAGRGVLEEEGGRWCSNALVLARQQAQELQQQNDALVRVLERERQDHARTRQQVSELKLDLKEAQTDWEVKLQALRQEKVAAQAQLRRALAGDQQELLDAFDAALAASTARTEEAQTAAACLASQITELELQAQQLQLICSASTGITGDSTAAASGLGPSSRADNAAVVRAVASAEGRSPEKQRSPCRGGMLTPKAAAEGCSGRGLRALRQHQTHLEQQLAKQTEELEQLQRDNIRLMRYKKQFEVAAQSLQAAAAAKAAAEAFAQDAGLHAASAAGEADRLELQVDELQLQIQQLRTERDRLLLQSQLQAAQQLQQQQQLQATLVGAPSKTSQAMAGVAVGSGLSYSSGPSASAGAFPAAAGSSSWQSAGTNSGPETAGARSSLEARVPGSTTMVAGTPPPSDAGAGGTIIQAGLQQQPAGPDARMVSGGAIVPGLAGDQAAASQAPGVSSMSASFSLLPALKPIRTAPAGLTGSSSMRRSSSSMSGVAVATPPAGSAPAAAAAVPVSAAEQAALSVVQQLQVALPEASPVHGQLATLMNAIQAGMQERRALNAQGQVLLDMLAGGS